MEIRGLGPHRRYLGIVIAALLAACTEKTASTDLIIEAPSVGVVSSSLIADHIVINEVYIDSDCMVCTPVEGDEFIELYNPTLYPVDISGWRVGDAIASDLIPGPAVIDPDSF